MASTLTDSITEILNQAGPGIIENRQRFLSAIQDTGSSYSEERKLLSRCMDDTYHGICAKAAKSSPDQLPVLMQKATDYLKSEYHVSNEWAESISEAIVYGIGAYHHGPDALKQRGRKPSVQGKPIPEKRDEHRTEMIDEPPFLHGGGDMTIPTDGNVTIPGGGFFGPDRNGGSGGIIDYPEHDSGHIGRMPKRASTGGGGGRQQEPVRDTNPNRRKKMILAVCAAIVLGLAIGSAAFIGFGDGDEGGEEASANEGTTSEQTAGSETSENVNMPVSDISVLDHDVNFSQITHQEAKRSMTFENDGVDCLIKVSNKGSSTVRSISFEWRQFEPIRNVKGGEGFTAFGLIPPGKTGYMYSKLFIPNDTPGNNSGTIIPKKINAIGNPHKYRLGSGNLEDQHPERDTYDVSVVNDNEDNVLHKGATIIVRVKDSGDLVSAWGAGTLSMDIAPGDEVYLDDALYNPGIEADDDSDYVVNVIDPRYLQ